VFFSHKRKSDVQLTALTPNLLVLHNLAARLALGDPCCGARPLGPSTFVTTEVPFFSRGALNLPRTTLPLCPRPYVGILDTVPLMSVLSSSLCDHRDFRRERRSIDDMRCRRIMKPLSMFESVELAAHADDLLQFHPPSRRVSPPLIARSLEELRPSLPLDCAPLRFRLAWATAPSVLLRQQKFPPPVQRSPIP